MQNVSLSKDYQVVINSFISVELSTLTETMLNETLSNETRCGAVSTICTSPPLRNFVPSLQGESLKQVMNAVYDVSQSFQTNL